jgi:hypothetical protein
MRGVVENTFRFVGGELQAPDPENHQDQTVAQDERTYFVDAANYGLSFNSQPSRRVFHLYSSCNDRKRGLAVTMLQHWRACDAIPSQARSNGLDFGWFAGTHVADGK